MQIGQQNKFFADFCILKAYSARKAGAFGGDAANRALRPQLVLRKRKQMTEWPVFDTR